MPTTTPAPAFPVTVEADNGSVTLEEQPDAIVSLSPTATESLFAIGAGEQVIAVDDQSNYPAEAPVTDLSGFQPNVEAIAGYEPDLVIAAYDPGGLVDGLEKLDIPVLLQDAAPDLEGAYDQIETLGAGDRTRRRGRGRRRSRCRPRSRSWRSRPGAAGGATVYHELGPDFFSATSETFIGSVYALLGLVNIADEAPDADAGGYPQLSAEYIVYANPDLIVLADTKCCEQTAATVAKRPGWDQIDAVANGHDRRGRRRHHVPLGPADGRLRRGGCRRARRNGSPGVTNVGGFRARLPARPERALRGSPSAGPSPPASSSSWRRCSGWLSGRSTWASCRWPRRC